MKRLLLALLLALVLLMAPTQALAATTAEVTITVTFEYIAITVSPTSWAAGTIAVDTATAINAHTVDNTSTVATNVSIKVSGDWTGGAGYTASDDGAGGAATVGLMAGEDDVDDTFDVVVKKTAAYNNIVTNKAATTDWYFGLKIFVPTSGIHGSQVTNTVVLTASKYT